MRGKTRRKRAHPSPKKGISFAMDRMLKKRTSGRLFARVEQKKNDRIYRGSFECCGFLVG